LGRFLKIHPEKFKNPKITAMGQERAKIKLKKLKTLWINTGTLCNIKCSNCYIKSSPRNDRLSYIKACEVNSFLNETEEHFPETEEIGLTGGEPFMNPHISEIIDNILKRKWKVLVLTNAMKPMIKMKKQLLYIKEKYGQKLKIRVSLDHYSKRIHEKERGSNTWETTLSGLKWLKDNDFNVNIAGRSLINEKEEITRLGYKKLFKKYNLKINDQNTSELVIFPEMNEHIDVPEITNECWKILNVNPENIMCSSSRMIVKRKEANKPTVVACTLLPYEEQFELGQTLKESKKEVNLNHPHCAQFCVLGGASCQG